MLRSHALEKAAQNQKPSIASTLRQPLCEIPLYFEHLDGQPVLGEADQSAIAHMINSFPEELKHRAAGVYFLGRDSFNTLHDYGPADEIAGFTEMASATIVIKVRQDEADRYQALRKDGQTVSLNDPLCYQETLIHEFTHLLDVRPTGKTPCLSQREDWLDLYTRYQSLLGDYAMSAPTEYFAETGVFYFLYPHLLQKICPELYGWFDANALNPQGRITLDSGLFCFLGPCREMRKDEKQNGQERAGGAWGRRKKNESGYHPDSKKGSRKK